MPIRTNELDRVVAFSQRGEPTAEGASFGNPVGDWCDRFKVWAKVKYLRGSEPVIQSRLEGRQPAVVTVESSRQTRGVTEEWRIGIKEGDCWRYYGITAVTPHDDREGIDFLAVYGAAVG